jgi:lipoic acid synthetase
MKQTSHPQRRPPWLKVRLPLGETFLRTRRAVSGHRLHTVCEEARCPNIGECWGAGTATFMILGDVCTRSCGFCSVKTGRPGPLDEAEPLRVARAVAALGLRHAVVTSVNRDERPDGGAGIFAATILEIRRLCPGCTVEVLIPDFKGSAEAQEIVFSARPDVLGHNVETVPRLYRTVRPQADYRQSLEVLARAKARGLRTKSSLMLGLGEREEEVDRVLRDLRGAGCDIVTLGQYLQPTRMHLPVVRYVPPEEFARWAERARELGFLHCESGPLVRSSYHAERAVGAAAPRA